MAILELFVVNNFAEVEIICIFTRCFIKYWICNETVTVANVLLLLFHAMFIYAMFIIYIIMHVVKT